MKNLMMIILSILISITAFAQENYETRKIAAFNKIKVKSVVQVELYKSDSQEIEITTKNVPTEKITSQVKNGKLYLDLESRRKGWNDIEIKVRVPYQELTNITGATASSIKSEELLTMDELTISLGEASNCNLSLDVELLDINLESASQLHLSGTCEEMDADINSAASLNAYDLITKIADVDANSMGKAKLHVKDELKVSANSMAKVRYKGNPGIFHQSKSSMATITQMSSDLKEIK